MAGLQVGIKLDDADVKALFKRAPEAAQQRLRQVVERGAVDVQRELIQAAPVGVHGGSGLRGSIHYRLDASKLSAEVTPDISYAEPVEKGTRPHWVSARPGSDLAKWARLKGLNPYAVQKSIARKGTKAHPYVQPTYEKMKPKVEHDMADGMQALVRDLNHGVL